jgi:hypothetical protein
VGAGKTTFARRLEQQEGAIRFTHDEWMHRLYGPNPPADRFQTLARRVEELIWQLAGDLLSRGVDVILDTGFWSRASRDEARRRVERAGATCLLYRLNCDEQILRSRVERRSGHVPPDSLWINQAAFEQFKGRFEPLCDDEARIEVDGVTGRILG